ncbi:hypothetical protein Tsubulata_008219, partial [Turnera subulata]
MFELSVSTFNHHNNGALYKKANAKRVGDLVFYGKGMSANDGIDTTIPPDETDITEALYAQQQLLQQLYAELDAEREAAETATSEALSMILRLQGEKASLKMEAAQYKRMAEEKMTHAEEALEIFEDLIHQREMEIASLEFQVQAYRYRLLSMGCNDLGVYENKFPENLLIQRVDSSGEKGANNGVRRLSSLPVQPKDPNQKKGDRTRSGIPSPDSITIVGESPGQEVKELDRKASAADLISYWEQIKRLDERVKEISDSKDSSRRNRTRIARGSSCTPSFFSQASSGTSTDPPRATDCTDSDNPGNSSTVQDIFEVPSATESRKPCIPRKKLTVEVDKRLGKPDLFSEDTLKASKQDEKDQVRTMLPTSIEKRLPKPRGGTMGDYSVSPVHRPGGPGHSQAESHRSVGPGHSQAEYQQLSQRVEQLERARNNARQEIVAGGDEGLSLLKEINEQLKSLQSEIRDLKPKKSNQPSLDPLRE